MDLNIINETLIEYSFSNKISLEISEDILNIYNYLSENLDYQKMGLIEITPTFNTIAVSYKSFSPLFNDPDYLRDTILLARESENISSYKTHTVEIIYDGLDLDEVCQSLDLTKTEFISVHQKNIYTVAMLGFKGNFPYLLGLDKKLALPRRSTPRNLVAKGSVAIGSDQCGIYTHDSPGGWHIIGNTNFNDFESLNAGDKIVFKSPSPFK